MWYPGMPEGQGFDEAGPRHYLEVEIEDNATRVTPVVSSRVMCSAYDLDCSGIGTAQQILDQLRAWALEVSQPQIARVTLTGLCRASVTAELPSVYDAAAGGFEHLVLLDKTSPAEDFEELAEETSTLGTFIARINAELEDAPDARRKKMLERAREVGLAAHRDQKPAIIGLEIGGEAS